MDRYAGDAIIQLMRAGGVGAREQELLLAALEALQYADGAPGWGEAYEERMTPEIFDSQLDAEYHDEAENVRRQREYAEDHIRAGGDPNLLPPHIARHVRR